MLKVQHCDNEVDETYELFAWYEPLLMIDLIVKMKLLMSIELLWMDMSMFLMFFDDDCGWMIKKKVVVGRKWE